MVVLDTNVIIDFLEGKEKVVAAVLKYPPSELATTFINRYEMLKYKERERVETPFENLFLYHSNETAIRAAANAYRQLKDKGIVINDNDLLIFGACVANNETLLTQDKGFENLHSELVKMIK
jgi:predicted nucleic acid-binding protein